MMGVCVSARLGPLLGWSISCWWKLCLVQRCLNVFISGHTSGSWFCPVKMVHGTTMSIEYIVWESTLLVVPDVDGWKGSVVEEEVFYFYFCVVGLGVSNSLGECRLNASLAALSFERCLYFIV